MTCSCNYIKPKKSITSTVSNCCVGSFRPMTEVYLANMFEVFNPYKHYPKSSVISFKENLYIAKKDVYPSLNNTCCGTTGSVEYPEDSDKWEQISSSPTALKDLENKVEEIDNTIQNNLLNLDVVEDFTVASSTTGHTLNLTTNKQSFAVRIPKPEDTYITRITSTKTGSTTKLVFTQGNDPAKTKEVSFTDTDTKYQAGRGLSLTGTTFNVDLTTLVDNVTIGVEGNKLKSLTPAYNDTQVQTRLTALEGKTDKFITGITPSRQGNTVTLRYQYSDGTNKSLSFQDSDTITLAYDDSTLRGRITNLENQSIRYTFVNSAGETIL